ncbi:UNVERIFIED_CONTAM: hypothetical protein HHA_462000 [Hammondia hammondi]|eukprot:XP_008884000.1 hypothetical protein HHA_462000 [Hammondia hammondi]
MDEEVERENGDTRGKRSRRMWWRSQGIRAWRCRSAHAFQHAIGNAFWPVGPGQTSWSTKPGGSCTESRRAAKTPGRKGEETEANERAGEDAKRKTDDGGRSRDTVSESARRVQPAGTPGGKAGQDDAARARKRHVRTNCFCWREDAETGERRKEENKRPKAGA